MVRITLVGPVDDLVPFLEAVQRLDIGGSGNSGGHLAENGLTAAYHEYALKLFPYATSPRRIGLGSRRGPGGASGGFHLQVALLPGRSTPGSE